MSRTFAYCRTSKQTQTTDNQVLEIASAGFNIEPHRILTEVISGSVAASLRPVFKTLLERLEAGDILVVSKLDRLGRNSMDVRTTVEQLEKREVRVHCLALGGLDLTSAAGKMTMSVISAVAEMERDLIVERTNSGLARAVYEGKVLGRKPSLSKIQKDEILLKLNQEGVNVSALAQEYKTTRQTILRVKNS